MKYLNKKMGIYLMAGVLLLSGMLTITITITAAKEPGQYEKNITSVYIEKGDSLWTIAKEFYTEGNRSMKAYIDEIKDCNHLSSNKIKEGQNLVVPYYKKM